MFPALRYELHLLSYVCVSRWLAEHAVEILSDLVTLGVD